MAIGWSLVRGRRGCGEPDDINQLSLSALPILALLLHEGLDQGLILQEALAFIALHVTRYNFVP
jgi:hypothetical protein